MTQHKYWVEFLDGTGPAIFSDQPDPLHPGSQTRTFGSNIPAYLPKAERTRLYNEWVAQWAALDGVEPEQETVVGATSHGANSGPVDYERQQRQAEALAYVAAYKGTWGLPLDIRTDRRFGTKHMRLSDRQIEVLLAGKARDEARSAQAATDPRAEAAKAWLIERAPRLQSRPGFLADMAARAVAGQGFSPRQLEVITRIISEDADRARTARAASPADAPTGPAAEGTYRTPDGEIYRVVIAVHGSGHPYARRLVVVEHGRADWEMAKGMVYRLRPEWKMTLEQAAEFGRLYGVCAHCSAPLTDPESIERGIGPVCARKF